MKRTIDIVQNKTVQREITVSDFSGVQMPKFHWSTVVRANLEFPDQCGNMGHGTICLDLMPEEMRDFREGIAELISSLSRKYKQMILP